MGLLSQGCQRAMRGFQKSAYAGNGVNPTANQAVGASAVNHQMLAPSLNNNSLSVPSRFGFVDSLRGIAALSVAAYHIFRYGPLSKPTDTVVPEFITAVVHRGWIGVQMFFVISGFVIAYTLRSTRITPKFLGNFALRRSLRLDPPYWCTILFVLFLYAFIDFWSEVQPTLLSEMPSWQKLLSHIFYLQNVLGYGNISVGFWTLCIEVQFYLLFALLLAFAQRLTVWRGGDASQPHSAALMLVFAPLALVSLFVFSLNQGNTDWVIHFFAFFFLGALAWWTIDGRTPSWMFWSFVAAILVRQSYWWTLDMTVALTAGVAIYGVIRTGRSVPWLEMPWLQKMGRISYSLYLIHYPISWIITTLGYELTGEKPGWALFWILASIAASIGVAHALHALIENPSIRFANRFKRLPAAQPILVPVVASARSSFIK